MLSVLISIFAALVILGLVLWLIGLLPLDPTILQIICGVAIIIAVLYVLQAFGLFASWSFPRFR